MKQHKLILLALFTLGVSFLQGQPFLGIAGGVTSAKLTGDSPENAGYKGLISFSFGINLDLNLGKQLDLSIQPSYSQEGTRLFYDVPFVYDAVDSVRIRFHYFSVPLILKAASSNHRFYAIGGLEAAYLLGSMLKTSSIKENINDQVTSYNVAVIFGAGTRIPVGNPRLIVELRYKQGIVNLNGEAFAKSYITRVKTSGLQVNLGLEIPLAAKKRSEP